jgi:hypothetical protein
MKRFRPALNAVLGLLLLVQGVAAAATGFAPISADETATEMAAMPCHGDMTGAGGHASCCDADCPNMAACALGHIAAASAPSLDVVATAHPARVTLLSAPVALPLPSLLRPPISFHA